MIDKRNTEFLATIIAERNNKDVRDLAKQLYDFLGESHYSGLNLDDEKRESVGKLHEIIGRYVEGENKVNSNVALRGLTKRFDYLFPKDTDKMKNPRLEEIRKVVEKLEERVRGGFVKN